jgi:hypothetical protein
MGLAKLDKLKKEEKASLEVDLFEITGDHDIFRFREPRAADLFPNPELKQEIKIAFPEFPSLMIDQVCLLGKTYLKDETDTEVNPIRSFGMLARNHRNAFLYIFTKHWEYFQRDPVDEEVAEVKNAYTE